MTTPRESFFTRKSYVFIGHNDAHPFPRISFGALQKKGVRVIPVDPTLDEVEGVPVLRDLEALEGDVEAAIIEVPREETLEWVEKVVARGIRAIWIHMGTDTREAADFARERGIELWTGGCAAMYTVPDPSFHMIHRFFVKLAKRY